MKRHWFYTLYCLTTNFLIDCYTCMYNILFLGDSLTAGYGLINAHNESFPALIQQKINQAGLPYHITNAGISGDTTTGGLGRVDYWLSRPLDVFVLELGVNDIMRGVPVETISRNLQTIIHKVKAKYPEAKIALMGMEVPVFVPVPFVREFRTMYRTLSEINKLAYLPFFLEGVAGQKHLNMRDGLHPTAEGYKIIAANAWKILQPLLKSVAV